MLAESRPLRPPAQPAGGALLALGFRPFYLLAAATAALLTPLWAAVYAGALSWSSALPPHLWHAHEMVFGFAVAVIVGFLFTAVRNWTGLATPTGVPLLFFTLGWLAARVAWWMAPAAPAVLVEIGFLVAVGVTLIRLLHRAGNRRNYFVAAMFGVLAAVDAVMLVAPEIAVKLALFIVVTLTFVMGGRVIPSFTANAIPRPRETLQNPGATISVGVLRKVAGNAVLQSFPRQFQHRRLDQGAIAAGVAAMLAYLVQWPAPIVAALASIAAVAHAVRLVGWNPWATRRMPILWILHLSYAWIPLAFAILALGALEIVPSVNTVLALHAFALGNLGGLVIGMITRTALGHTGRPLVAGRAETAMYVLVHLAALARVAGPIAMPAAYATFVNLAATLWTAAFALYFVVYAPRLARARPDGKPG